MVVAQADERDNMASNTLETRILLMSDSTTAWASSTKIILKGEVAFEFGTDTTQPPKIKIGDGTHTFAELPYAVLSPSEIDTVIENALATFRDTIHTHSNKAILDKIEVALTNALKANYDKAYTHSQSAHAPSNAEKNKIESIKVNGTAQTIDEDRAVDISVPISGSEVIVNGNHMLELKSVAASKVTGELSADNIPGISASKISSGIIDVARLPKVALDTLVKVADDDARYKLTSSEVQTGDTVYVNTTNKMYLVVDNTKLSSDDGYAVYAAGSAATVNWSGVLGKPSTYAPSAHTHTISEVTNLQTTLNGKSPLIGNTSLKQLSSTVTLGSGGGAYIEQVNNTYRERIKVNDSSDEEVDEVFGFYQSSDSGENYTDLLSIRKTGTVVAKTFSGNLNGLATNATNDASGNKITTSYGSSLSVNGQTVTLLSKSGDTLSSITTQDTWRPVVNNLSSTVTTSSLSANQGRILNNTISNHANNKSNPHSVTKEQVGLKNVANYTQIIAISGDDYYGMGLPDGTATKSIRTTSDGLLPYQSGLNGSGHSSLGSSTWYFKTAYIDNIFDSTGKNIKANYVHKIDSDNGFITYTMGDGSIGSLSLGTVDKIINVALSASGWTQDSTTGRYTQSVSNTELKSTYNAICASRADSSWNSSTLKAYNKAFGIVSQGTATITDGAATFSVMKQPSVDITVALYCSVSSDALAADSNSAVSKDYVDNQLASYERSTYADLETAKIAATSAADRANTAISSLGNLAYVSYTVTKTI